MNLGGEHMEKLFKNKKIKRVVSLLLMLVVLGTSMGLERFVQVIWAQTTYIKIYLKDNTIEHWLGNDNAVMELVDNTSGHIHYRMTKEDSETWSIKVPDTTYNVTFNRLSPDGNTQWNSWSAGGRDSNNVYFADGGEYGHWEVIEDDNEEKYFHAGDIVYLDLTQFVAWKSSDALLYINFTGASKKENNGQDINLSKADKSQYNPKKVDMEVTENIYAYVVGFEDEGSTELRFWRGNNSTLWNCSIILSYDDYVNGVNCVRISNWDNEGSLIETEHKMDTEVDSDGDGLPDYYEYIHNTDIYKADTDGDGLTDYQEINETATNPNMMDTNGDGIGDLRGIISKLDYLKKLGIDIIWLSPIYKSPFVDQGYDIADYYAIAEEFGTMEEFDELLAEAKKRDMHIIMDLVINHCSDKHEWFQKALADPDGPYADYFYFRKGKNGNPPSNYRSYFGGSCWEPVPGTDLYYLHMFAKEQPDLNWENPVVRKKLYEMVNWWLDKGVAGFRIDAIINIKKDNNFPSFEPD